MTAPPSGPPLIGITGRRLPGTSMSAMEPRYQARDIDMYFSDYPRRVAEARGLPVQIPYDADPFDLINRLDGLLITGGQDISPARWGGRSEDVVGDTDPQRDAYEIALVDHALHTGVPVLGICRGMQVINVARGGTLIGDLDTAPIAHRGPGRPVETLIHSVSFTPGSIANRVFGETVAVNSLHHQAVGTPGQDVVITGSAPDGVAETLELTGHCLLAVQWHPEWMPYPDPSLQWLVTAANAHRLSAQPPAQHQIIPMPPPLPTNPKEHTHAH